MTRALVLVALGAVVPAWPANSAELALPREGWVSWQVEAADHAPAWCCWGSSRGAASDRDSCDLDGDSRGGYGSRDGATTTAVRVYAKFAAGKLLRVRALAAQCPVQTRTPIAQLDHVATDDSARWLAGLARATPGGRSEDADDVLAALAIHRGAIAADALRDLGQTGADPDVRAHAWFWFAQAGAPGAEAALLQAVRQDADDGVREQAIFALSQLPGERATPALIAAAEDRSLPREQRRRAVFWLTESKSPDAFAYLDEVFARAAVR